MSFELDEIRRVLLGREADSCTNEQLLKKYECNTLEEFFQKVWTKPDPCYFLWVNAEQLRELKGKPLYKHNNLTLIRVDISTFYKCNLNKQRFIVNDESGFKVKKINNTLTIW